MTNRDLYLFVADLVERRKSGARSLEDYLRAFLQLASERRQAAGLDGITFASILERSFDAPAEGDEPRGPGASGYAELEDLVRRQIRDLREMGAAGTLRDEMRYFGKSAPSGEYWYNFDPCTFIECATAGTFRGWKEGDSTSRIHVPGEVAVVGEDGSIEGVDPRSIEDPIEELGLLGWEQIARFILMGQIYE
jgi:hypothetical protein